MSQVKITEAFQPKKRVAHRPKSTRKAPKTPEPEAHPALPSTYKTVGEEELEVLRQFDLNHEYGPCVGITRLERWQRAEKHRMNPPEAIKELISNHKDDVKYTQSVWFSYNI